MTQAILILVLPNIQRMGEKSFVACIPSLENLVYFFRVLISRLTFTLRVWSYGVPESLEIANEQPGRKSTVSVDQ